MKKINFGLSLPLESRDPSRQESWLEDMDRALELVTGHFDSAWLIDHLQFGDTAVLESFTTLAFLAARHPQLHFGHTVVCQSFRSPALVAKMGATLQLLTGGRYILGIGAGWHQEEYRAYGYDFPSNGVRVAQLEEAVRIIRGMWQQERTTFEGRYYRVSEARCEPKPDPVPTIMVGAFQPKMLRLTARYADWWNVSSTSSQRYKEMVAEFARACEEVGRDPDSMRRSWGGGCACAPTLEAARAFTKDWWVEDDDEDDFDFIGTPAQIVEQMKPFIDLGVDTFMLSCGGFPDLTTLELLVGDVLPAVNAG